MNIIITAKPFKEKRRTVYVYVKSIFVYPTNHGNLTAQEIADLENIAIQTVRNKIKRGLYSPDKKKVGRPLGSKKIKEVVLEKKSKTTNLGSWELSQLNKG